MTQRSYSQESIGLLYILSYSFTQRSYVLRIPLDERTSSRTKGLINFWPFEGVIKVEWGRCTSVWTVFTLESGLCALTPEKNQLGRPPQKERVRHTSLGQYPAILAGASFCAQWCLSPNLSFGLGTYEIKSEFYESWKHNLTSHTSLHDAASKAAACCHLVMWCVLKHIDQKNCPLL